MKKKIAFICIHNSARSQMAEELMRKYASENFDCYSAGIEPGNLNPVVVEILKEIEGIDITNKKTVSVQELIDTGIQLDYIVTVCDEGNAARCPVFPGKGKKLHWGFEDPSSLSENVDKKQKTLEIKLQIEQRIQEFLMSLFQIISP